MINYEKLYQKNQTKYWAVTNGRKLGVYDDFLIVDKLTRGYKNASYKVFEDYNETYEYLRKNQCITSKNRRKSQIIREDEARKREQNRISSNYCISCGKPLNVHYKINHKDTKLCKKCLLLPQNRRNKYLIDKSKTHYNKEDSAPQYIYNLLGEDKEFICIDGIKSNPVITFKCKKCNQIYTIKYKVLKIIVDIIVIVY